MSTFEDPIDPDDRARDKHDVDPEAPLDSSVGVGTKPDDADPADAADQRIAVEEEGDDDWER